MEDYNSTHHPNMTSSVSDKLRAAGAIVHNLVKQGHIHEETNVNGVWNGLLQILFPLYEGFVINPEGKACVGKQCQCSSNLVVRRTTHWGVILLFEGKGKDGASIAETRNELLQYTHKHKCYAVAAHGDFASFWLVDPEHDGLQKFRPLVAEGSVVTVGKGGEEAPTYHLHGTWDQIQTILTYIQSTPLDNPTDC
ncbi:hypothetical protein C8Q75DRAFT_353178 [Abortiporus biennis]|nr:hypothetical protein C8Q75DRAFT_353178 [Abortiporus biennis]